MSIVMEPERTASRLPDGWKWVRLGDVCCTGRGRVISQEYIKSHPGPYPVYSSQTKNDGIFGHIDTYDFEGKWITWTTDGANAGTVFYREGKFNCTNVCGTVRPRQGSLVDLRFLALVLSRLTSPHVNIASGNPKLMNNVFEQISVPLPPLPEQKRIAAILNEQMAAVEKARAACEAQLGAAKELPSAYLRSVFDSPEAKKWERKKLGDVALVSGGIQKSPDRAPNSFHRPYLTVRNVQRGYLDLSAVERFEISEAELRKLRLEVGDILVVEGNGSADQIGRNAIFRGEIQDCIHQNHLIRVRLNLGRCHHDFVGAYLNSDQGKSQMKEKAESTTGLHTLSVSKVQSIEVPVPPREAQMHIVSLLESRHQHLATIQATVSSELNAINNLPAAILRKAFNGEL